jgi:hypothetical protein
MMNKKNDKSNKTKSFREVVREVDEQDRIERQQLKEKYREIEEKNKAEYEKNLKKEKIELLKRKQGVKDEVYIGDSVAIPQERTKWKKFTDYIYWNKWWLGLVTFAVLLAAFLVIQLITRERPDMIVLLITDDTQLQNNTTKIEEFFENYIDDFNGNGKTEVTVYNLPMNEQEVINDYTRGNATGLSTQLQMGEAVLIITDDDANEYIDSDNILVNLEDQFPDDENVKGTGFYLSDTDFLKDLGLDGTLDSDICISIREVKDSYSFKKKMQKKFNQAYPVLEKIINDLDK